MKTAPLKRPKLHDAEKQEPYAGYYYHNSAQVPAPVIDEIKKSPYPCEHALLFNNINDLLNPEYLPLENGYCRMDDGGVFVAVLTQMPKVTGEMLDWWFWWHPMNSLRYRIWYPQAHFAATLDADPDEYRNRTGPYRQRYWHHQLSRRRHRHGKGKTDHHLCPAVGLRL